MKKRVNIENRMEVRLGVETAWRDLFITSMKRETVETGIVASEAVWAEFEKQAMLAGVGHLVLRSIFTRCPIYEAKTMTTAKDRMPLTSRARKPEPEPEPSQLARSRQPPCRLDFSTRCMYRPGALLYRLPSRNEVISVLPRSPTSVIVHHVKKTRVCGLTTGD